VFNVLGTNWGHQTEICSCEFSQTKYTSYKKSIP